MSRRTHLLLFVSPLVILAMAAPVLTAAPASETNTAQLATYDSPSGDTYFALSLPPTLAAEPAFDHDIVVLFDTSASQTGAYRDDAVKALRTMLAHLGRQDRVKLMAADLSATPMTRGFVAPNSEEMQAGLSKLQRRAALGSTDMLRVLDGAISSFSGQPVRPRSVVYIGDGISRANLLSQQEFADISDRLVNGRISVSSFAIGPGRDVLLLAALANHTGGMVYLDSWDGNWSEQAGQTMALVARGVVYWPVAADLPNGIREVYPETVPPLRNDRDTVLIGSLQSRTLGQITLNVAVDGRSQKLRWDVATHDAADDYSFLPQLVDTVRAGGGFGLPTLGTDGLREVARMVASDNESLAQLGRSALSVGHTRGAWQAANAVLRRDPNNPQAQMIRNAALRKGTGTDEPELRLVALQDADAPVPGAGATLEGFMEDQGDFLNLVEDTRQVLRQRMQSEVEQSLSDARDQMGQNPEGAKRELKLLLETVERSPDLDPDTRAQLRDQVESAIREAGRQAIEVATRRALAEENRAMADERQRIVEETARQRQKIKQMMARFNSLMDEGRYQDAEDIIAEEVRELDPLGTTPVVAVWNARFGGHVYTMERLREVRHRNFARTLLEVEKALVPFPGDPPILYPEPQVWADLSLRRKKYASIDLARQGTAEVKIFEALNNDARFDFIDTPLDQVVEFLRDQQDINIEIDTRALDDVGIGTDVPITRTLKGISLRSALRLILKELDLTYTVRDEVLLITTPEEAESELVTKVYPVGDLVIPIMSGMGMMGGMGGMGMMGGMGGGMGGMGMGGMGGMGMGGMGGGMGGMGGMGMGGMFAVEDDLKLGVKKTPKSPEPALDQQPRATSAGQANVPKIELDVQPQQSLDEAWNEYFEDLKQASEEEQTTARLAVRATARDLMKREKYDELVPLLMGALRHGFPQTWMYEGLGLAMASQGADEAEIERALMSVIDFSTSLDETLYVAEYMTHLDLDRRALQLFQNVAAAQPLRPEPYVRGLAAAQRLDDVDGIQWACVGILRQAWSKDQQEIEKTAARVTRATYERLLAEDRKEEAEAFKKHVDAALVRDCVIRITWTGDADVDLSVEEPTGTVCSAQTPRTTGGGVMLGDEYARLGARSADGYSEIYICPEGFTGQYRLLVKRIWGEPTAGKVTVEVVTNFRTEKQQVISKHVPLADGKAAVVFDLAAGRRQEPLEEQQIANVARVQEEIGRAILAQQLAAYEGSDAVRDYYRAALQARRDGRRPFRPGVGVRPEITVLPDGTTFSASAVISADRRYVRVTPMPMFSGVGEVTTFTFVGDETGQGGTGGGGFGGGGFGGGGFGGGGFGGGGISDQRLKSNVEPLEYGLETVKELNPVRYTWADSVQIEVAGDDGTTETKTIEPSRVLGEQNEVGLIAQEVEELVPEITTTDENGLKRMRYDLLVPVLIKAVQELSEENAQLKSDLDALKERLDAAGM